MEKPPTVQNYTIVPEEMIVHCAAHVADYEENSFLQVLEKGKEFKKVGMQPVFLSTPNFGHIVVTSLERIENKLH